MFINCTILFASYLCRIKSANANGKCKIQLLDLRRGLAIYKYNIYTYIYINIDNYYLLSIKAFKINMLNWLLGRFINFHAVPIEISAFPRALKT